MWRTPSRSPARVFLVALLSGLLALSGCQKPSDLPRTHPVSGKVVYPDGTPMKGGTIQFLSTSSDSSLLTSGVIDDNGGFTLSTMQDKHKAAGAVEGQYQVMILPPQTTDHQPVRPITLPETYTIKPGDNSFPAITIPQATR